VEQHREQTHRHGPGFSEDKYDFKLQKDQRNFAQDLLHVAAVDYDLMGSVSGSDPGPDFGKNKHNPSRDVYKTKADVVKLMQQAVADGANLDSTAGQRRAGQNNAICVGEQAGPQLLHLDVGHRAQRRALRPACGLLSRQQPGICGGNLPLKVFNCKPDIFVAQINFVQTDFV
jgi:hypothetical protein